MKKIILIISCLLAYLASFAQLGEARYASRITQDGVIYFIMPHSLKEVVNIKKFNYDLTLLSWTDSVTVNFTFESNSMLVPENLMLKSGDKSFVCSSYSPLFIDIKNKRYEIRITSQFSVDEINTVLNSAEPPVFYFTQDKIPASATYKPGDWKKDRKKLIDIINLFNYTK